MDGLLFFIYDFVYFIFDFLFLFILLLQAIFLNVVSGVALTETSGDLAVAAAICSRHVFEWLVLCLLYN